MNTKKYLMLSIAALSITLAGCNGLPDLMKGAETAVHIKLLDAEFENTVAIVREYPLNAREAIVINGSIAELEIERNFLRSIHKQNAGRIALEAVQARKHIDDITKSVQEGRVAFLAHLDRTGAPLDPSLKNTYDSAVLARTNLLAAIDAGTGVNGADLAKYMTLAVRVMAASQGIILPARGPATGFGPVPLDLPA